MSIATRFVKGGGKPILDLGGCVFYAPFWRPDLGNTTFRSKDTYNHLCTVTGATYGQQGRSFILANSDVIVVPNHADMFPTDVITMIAWAKPIVVDTVQFLNGRAAGAATRATEITITAQGKLQVLCNDASLIATSVASLSISRFNHLAAVFDGANLICYLDGVKAVGSSAASIPSSIRDLQIGKWAGGSPFGGIIGEFGIWHRAFTQQEILKNMQDTQGRYL